MNCNPLVHTIHINQFQVDYKLDVKVKAITLMEDNIRISSWSWDKQRFLKVQKALTEEEGKGDKLGYIKIRNFWTSKDKGKLQNTKRSAIHITDKGPISYKGLLQISKRDKPFFLIEQTTRTYTFQKLYEKVLHHILSFISKTQTKTTVGYPSGISHPSEWQRLRKLTILFICKDVEQLENLCALLWDCNCHKQLCVCK